jgi:glycosyltransferase involved in cell wall biosynthesis
MRTTVNELRNSADRCLPAVNCSDSFRIRKYPMKVLALTRYGRLGASSRMRIYQYTPFLRYSGIEVEVSPLLRDDYLKRFYARQKTRWAAILADYLKQAVRSMHARRFDLLWIEKELFPNLPAWFEQALSALGIRYVVDYDDAVFHNYDLSLHPLKRILADKIDRVMRSSALVVCGNEYLAERARFAGARRVEVIPTTVDMERYRTAAPQAHDRIVVGWIGSLTTVIHLQLVADALRELASEFPLRLCVVGAQFAAPGIDIDCRPWSEDTEVGELQQFDIGIMPLIDTPFVRGKCGYKLIQYMAAGKPVVASPVGMNLEIVEHGRCGYLASTSDEWLSALRALCANSEARQSMGAQGRLTVEQRYCLQVTGPRIAQLFHEISAGGPA